MNFPVFPFQLKASPLSAMTAPATPFPTTLTSVKKLATLAMTNPARKMKMTATTKISSAATRAI